MKNKKVIIAVGALVLIVLVGASFFVLSSNKKAEEQVVVPEELEEIEETVNLLSPEEIGLVLTKNVNNTKVIMEIVKTDDILSLEYELSYTAKGDIPRGVIGNIENKAKGKPIKQEIVLGTCSDVCHYDEDVANITLLLKVAKTDNMVYSVEKTLD